MIVAFENPGAPGSETLAKALKAHRGLAMPALPGRTNHLLAPVVLPLTRDGTHLSLLATRRAATLAHHAGEICFPGGKPEARDQDLEATARRELAEELGLEVGPILGKLSRIPLYTSDHRLVPFVAEVLSGQTPRPEQAEVAEVLELDLASELARERIEAIPFAIGELSGLAPIFSPRRLDGSPQPALMYGATAMATYELLSVLAPLYGRTAAPELVVSDHDWESVAATAKPPTPKESP